MNQQGASRNQQGASRRGLFALSAGASVALAIPYEDAAAANALSTQPAPLPRAEVRPGVTIAYADDWFGPPWQDGAPILLLHGVAESHIAFNFNILIGQPGLTRAVRRLQPRFHSRCRCGLMLRLLCATVPSDSRPFGIRGATVRETA